VRLRLLLQQLSHAVRARKKAEQKVRTLKQRLIDQGDKRLQAWERELTGKTRKHHELTGLLKSTDAVGDEDDDYVQDILSQASQ
jgi:DNA sulfur modification protein DndD